MSKRNSAEPLVSEYEQVFRCWHGKRLAHSGWYTCAVRFLMDAAWAKALRRWLPSVSPLIIDCSFCEICPWAIDPESQRQG